MNIIDNIKWNIKHEPIIAINKNTNTQITNEELDTIIPLVTIGDDENKKVWLHFPLNPHDLSNICEETVFINLTIKKPLTIRQFLTIIYNFYQEPNHSTLFVILSQSNVNGKVEYA